jgi:CheY-like chemotaxis protein
MGAYCHHATPVITYIQSLQDLRSELKEARMAQRRVLLATKSRIFRELLSRVIEKTPDLVVAGEVSGDPKALGKMARETSADWVIVSMDKDGKSPRMANQILRDQPDLQILAITGDGGQMCVARLEQRERFMRTGTLEELLTLLARA